LSECLILSGIGWDTYDVVQSLDWRHQMQTWARDEEQNIAE
jgi:hypothetical protein